MPKKDGLELERPERFLVRERLFQRIGIAVLTLFVLAGAAGAFGEGPLSETTATVNGVQVQYERFARSSLRTKVNITVQTAASDGQPVRLRIARSFLERVSSLEVRPSEAHKGFDEEFAIFELLASQGKARLDLHYEPERWGIFDTEIAVEGAGTAAIRQLVYF